VGLTKAALARPVFVWMLMLATALAGIVSYFSMRQENNPDVQFGVITVRTVYPGAGPNEVNTLVTRKLEEAVSGVSRLQEVIGQSVEGASVVSLQFAVGADMDVALNEVRAKVDEVVGELPRDIEKPVVSKADTTSDPVLTVSFKSKQLSNRQIRDIADNQLKDLFARLPGVATVSVTGGEQREIQVRLRKDALLVNGVGITEVQQALQAASLNVPSGRIESGGSEYNVRVFGEFQTVEEIGDVFVTVRDPMGEGAGQPIRLSDIATIVDSNVDRRQYSRLDAVDAVTLTILKAKEGSAVEISNAVQKTPVGTSPNLLAQIQSQYGIESIVVLDSAETIGESLFDLQFALGFGIVLVGLVVWLFLHNLRGTLIVAIAIPVCLLGAILMLRIFGQTINNLSMLALSLAVGVLVDDAIVVLENIYRHLTLGEEPAEAALNGRSEIGLAAIAITLADVVVFVPIAFMGGVVGQFFRPLGIGFACAVTLSLLVSFTVTPMLAARWYRKGEDWEHPKGRFAQGFERAFGKFADGYARLLAATLRHRWYAFGVGWTALFAMFLFIAGSFAPTRLDAVKTGLPMAAAAFAIGVVLFLATWVFRRNAKPWLLLSAACFAAAFPLGSLGGFQYARWKGEDVFKFAFFPPSDSGSVQISVELPPGATTGKTEEVVRGLEEVAMAHPEAEYVTSRIGSRGGGFSIGDIGPNYASINVKLRDKRAILDLLPFGAHAGEELRTVSDVQVSADLLEQIGKVPGAKVNVGAGDGFGFGSAIQLSFQSNDSERLQETVEAVRSGLAAGAVAGVINVETSSKPGKPEFRAIPDRERQGDADVSTAEIGAALRVLYDGDVQTKFRVAGQEYDVRVQLDPIDRNTTDVLADVPVAFRRGDPVFLADVATVKPGQTVDRVERRDRREEVRVNADLLPGLAAGTVQAQIDDWLQRNGLPGEGVSYRALGQADVQARESTYLMTALLTGFVLVYMVLASLFNNLLYPFIVQLAQPQALVGALLALILTDKTLNIVGFIGIIAMVGLVGKNAILLVDYANTLRERGMPRFDALVEAGRTRLRPIMMTTLALLAGLMPVALAIGRGSEFRETIGITIIGGTLLSTLLTLLVIPCSYSIFDDLAAGLAGARAAVAKRRRSGEPKPEPRGH
jgi:HAE1 family hydrophobic/amphiphilic exporter-1